MMRLLFAILSGIALVSAATILPRAKVQIGHLTYGDVELDLKVGCQNVPQNADDGLPAGNFFTKLQVGAGYTCELYQSRTCEKGSIMVTKGPSANAEYTAGLFSAKCRKT